MKITEARITALPTNLFGPMPEVFVTVGGVEQKLFSFYPDEITFVASEFVGLTIDEVRELRHKKDVAYLRS
jgi:hypothetical protein